jgi:hypothetical protein
LQFGEFVSICACSKPKLLEGHGARDQGREGGCCCYKVENNGFIMELRSRLKGPRLHRKAVKIKKRGKCFHTGNIAFPLSVGLEDW